VTSFLEQALGLLRVLGRRRKVGDAGHDRRHGPTGDGAVALEVLVDVSLRVHRQSEGLPNSDVLRWPFLRVEVEYGLDSGGLVADVKRRVVLEGGDVGSLHVTHEVERSR